MKKDLFHVEQLDHCTKLNVEQQDDRLKMLKVDQIAKKIESSILKAVSNKKQ